MAFSSPLPFNPGSAFRIVLGHFLIKYLNVQEKSKLIQESLLIK